MGNALLTFVKSQKKRKRRNAEQIPFDTPPGSVEHFLPIHVGMNSRLVMT